jgi:predicted dinucleotide-binding enzyme
LKSTSAKSVQTIASARKTPASPRVSFAVGLFFHTGDFMTYSIVGSGNIGTAVARQFARKGIEVALANTRGPESLLPFAKQLGHQIVPQTLELALDADIVILATPFSAIADIARSRRDWKGKIVVDATNAIDFPSYTPTDLGGRPSSEAVAEQLPGARLVKAFNTLPAAVLAADPIEGRGQRVLFISGNDAQANSLVADLIEKLGFAPITLGMLAEGGLLQQYGGPLMVQNLIKVR